MLDNQIKELEASRDAAAEIMILLNGKEELLKSFFDSIEKGYRQHADSARNWDEFVTHRAVADFVQGYLFHLADNAEGMRDQMQITIDELIAEQKALH